MVMVPVIPTLIVIFIICCCFVRYHLQRSIPVAMASLRNTHGICPSEVLKFILDLFRYSDNSRNKVNFRIVSSFHIAQYKQRPFSIFHSCFCTVFMLVFVYFNGGISQIQSENCFYYPACSYLF